MDDSAVLHNTMTAVYKNNNRNTGTLEHLLCRCRSVWAATFLKPKATPNPFTSLILIYFRCFSQFFSLLSIHVRLSLPHAHKNVITEIIVVKVFEQHLILILSCYHPPYVNSLLYAIVFLVLYLYALS